MAGRKTFVAQEVLTASDVNSFLMDQSVMVFDDAAARTTGIPSPTEGMVTYLKDTDAVEKFTGSSFVPVGGLVAVKSALKTDAESFTSVSAGANVAVTGLSITHAMASANNKLIISAYFGVGANSQQVGNLGLVVADGTTLIGIGNAAGNRTRLVAGGAIAASTANSNFLGTYMAVRFVYEPGDTASRTYTVRAVNVATSTQTLFVNRFPADDDNAFHPRASSALIIEEVAV